MRGRQIDLGKVGLGIFLIVFFILIVLYQDTLSKSVLVVLEWKFFNATLWGYFTVSYILHFVSVRNIGVEESAHFFRQFGLFIETGFSIVTYAVASTTSAAILKGVYIQKFIGGDIYFNHFDDMDIYSMLFVSGFLLWYSLKTGWAAFVNGITVSQANMAVGVRDSNNDESN